MGADILKKILPLYGDQIMQDHQTATLCSNVEETLLFGNSVFDMIRLRHRNWHGRVQSDAEPYTVEDAETFAQMYKSWQESSVFLVGKVKQFEQQGYTVTGAAEMREHLEQLALLDLDVRALSETFSRLDSEGGLSLDEFFDGLSDSNRTGCASAC